MLEFSCMEYNFAIDLSSGYIWTFAAGMFFMRCWGAWLSWRDREL